MAIILIFAGLFGCLLSGIVPLFFRRSPVRGQRIAVVLMMIGSSAGLAGSLLGMAGNYGKAVLLSWPAAGDMLFDVDSLSAFFLVPVFILGGLGSLYGLGYWPGAKKIETVGKLQFFWGLLIAGLVLLVTAKQQMAFLLGWEIMALCGFFLVSTEDHLKESRKAAWIYFVATHAGTLILFGLFAFWHGITGSFAMVPIGADRIGLAGLNALFLMIMIGFGLKAGIMPFHFWLPAAHANAPSHVSAIMSGVMLKMGIYGIIRFLSLLPNPPAAWGGLILILGIISGLLGVIYALAQHDIKRLLAYHSIENIGIILMGLGLAMLGRTAGKPVWIVLGLGGCLLHVWNHSFFKALLFLSAGSVIHATGTRQIDQLGGLAKKMPQTAALFFIGAVAISGLPPLNGFISELLIYLGLFQTGLPGAAAGTAAMAAVPALAMIGSLAVACFVKVYGTVFLGTARSPAVDRAFKAPWTMRLPMAVLAALCVTIGLAPFLAAPLIDSAIYGWIQPFNGRVQPFAFQLPPLHSLVPFVPISLMSVALILVFLGIRAIPGIRRKPVRKNGTWDCGYSGPTCRMQYSAASFAQPILSLFDALLKPVGKQPRIKELFPRVTKMETHVNDPVLDRFLLPAAGRIERITSWFWRFQHGVTQSYLFYMLIAAAILLGFLIPFRDIFARLFFR